MLANAVCPVLLGRLVCTSTELYRTGTPKVCLQGIPWWEGRQCLPAGKGHGTLPPAHHTAYLSGCACLIQQMVAPSDLQPPTRCLTQAFLQPSPQGRHTHAPHSLKGPLQTCCCRTPTARPTVSSGTADSHAMPHAPCPSRCHPLHTHHWQQSGALMAVQSELGLQSCQPLTDVLCSSAPGCSLCPEGCPAMAGLTGLLKVDQPSTHGVGGRLHKHTWPQMVP